MSRLAGRWVGAFAIAALILSPLDTGLAQEAPVAVSLVAARGDVRADALTVEVRFSIRPGWHIYAPNPGDAGLPTTVHWTVPRGYRVGAVQWPEPQAFAYGADVSFGYSGELVLPVTVHRAATQSADPRVPIRAEVRWAACADVCIPGRVLLELVLVPRASRDVQ